MSQRFLEAFVEHSYNCACEVFDWEEDPVDQIDDYFAFRNVKMTDDDFLADVLAAHHREELAGGGPFTDAARCVDVIGGDSDSG